MNVQELSSHLHTQIGHMGINEHNQTGLLQAIINASYCLGQMGLKETSYLDSATSVLVVGACLTFKGRDLQTHKHAIGSLLTNPNFLNPPEQLIDYDHPQEARPIRKPVSEKERVFLSNGPLSDHKQAYFPTFTIHNLRGNYLEKDSIDDILKHVPIIISTQNSEQFVKTHKSRGFYYKSAIHVPHDFDTGVLHHELTHTLGRISIACSGLPDYENFVATDELTVEALSTQELHGKKCSQLKTFRGYDWIRTAFVNNLPNLPVDVLLQQFSAMYKNRLHASATHNFIKSLLYQFNERNLARVFQLCRLSVRKSSHLPMGVAIDPTEWGPGKIYW